MNSRAFSPYIVALIATAFFLTACNSSSVAPSLTVNFLGDGGGKVVLSKQGAADTEHRQGFTETFQLGEVVELTAVTAEGSVFTGWDGDCSGNSDASTCQLVMDSGKDVRATFAKKTFTLTLKQEGTGSGRVRVLTGGEEVALCSDTCEVAFTAGSTVTLEPIVDSGATFTSWDGDCSSPGPTCRLTMDAPKTVTAVFDSVDPEPTLHTLSVVLAGSGSGMVTSSPVGIDCGSDCRAPYPKDTVVTLSATPDAASTFSGWSGACSGTGTCKVTMSASRTVTASFDQKPVQLELSLAGTGAGSVTSSPAGIDCPAVCTASFDYGSEVTLSAAPETGSGFSGWSGACTGTAACTLTLTSDTSVTASFSKDSAAPATYTLSVRKTGSGSGMVTSAPAGINCGSDCRGSFEANSEVSLNASASTGSVFAGWQNCTRSSGTVCYVTLASNAQVTAIFNRGSGLEKKIVVPIRRASDDAEQFLKKPSGNALPANATDTTGGDLDLGYDTRFRTQQLVGLRFRNLNIPQGATITNAYIQFISDEDYAHTTYPTLYIRAEANPKAPTFVQGAINNISDRPVTAAQVTWRPPLWGDEGRSDAANEEERSPDLSALVQEVVDHPDWNASSNALVFIVRGDADSTAHRAATSREDTDGPAQLFVTYRY